MLRLIAASLISLLVFSFLISANTTGILFAHEISIKARNYSQTHEYLLKVNISEDTRKIEKMVFKIDGKKVHIPKPAYGDLDYPQWKSFAVSDSSTILFDLNDPENKRIIHVDLEYKDYKVVKRYIQSFPREGGKTEWQVKDY